MRSGVFRTRFAVQCGQRQRAQRQRRQRPRDPLPEWRPLVHGSKGSRPEPFLSSGANAFRRRERQGHRAGGPPA